MGDVSLGFGCLLTPCVVLRLVDTEKKLEADEEEAGEDLLKLHEELASLQARMAIAAGRLARLRKTRTKVKEKRSEMVRRGLRGLDEEDGLLDVLDVREGQVMQELQLPEVPDDFDWSSVGLGMFSDLNPSVLDPSLSSAVARETPSADAAHG